LKVSEKISSYYLWTSSRILWCNRRYYYNALALHSYHEFCLGMLFWWIDVSMKWKKLHFEWDKMMSHYCCCQTFPIWFWRSMKSTTTIWWVSCQFN
jgi:hypothetical protein